MRSTQYVYYRALLRMGCRSTTTMYDRGRARYVKRVLEIFESNWISSTSSERKIGLIKTTLNACNENEEQERKLMNGNSTHRHIYKRRTTINELGVLKKRAIFFILAYMFPMNKPAGRTKSQSTPLDLKNRS